MWHTHTHWHCIKIHTSTHTHDILIHKHTYSKKPYTDTHSKTHSYSKDKQWHSFMHPQVTRKTTHGKNSGLSHVCVSQGYHRNVHWNSSHTWLFSPRILLLAGWLLALVWWDVFGTCKIQQKDLLAHIDISIPISTTLGSAVV